MDAREQKRYRIAIAVVTGIGVLGLAWDLLRGSPAKREGAEEQKPAQVAPPGKYPVCDDAEAFYARTAARMGCGWHGWLAGRAICEMPYRNRPRCVPLLDQAVKCIKALPESSWRCDVKYGVNFRDQDCQPELVKLRTCIS